VRMFKVEQLVIAQRHPASLAKRDECPSRREGRAETRQPDAAFVDGSS
jgi:hypothetical protein